MSSSIHDGICDILSTIHASVSENSHRNGYVQVDSMSSWPFGPSAPLRRRLARLKCGSGQAGQILIPSGLVNTTTELLHGLHEPGNNPVWEEFDRRYRPILFGFLRKAGLTETDAADVAQDTMTCFVQDYRDHKYDRAQGRLRSWLIGIARCRLADRRRLVARRREARGESAIEVLPDDAHAEQIWESEQQRYIFEQAIAELHKTARFSEKTIQAFERVVLRRESVESVSKELELSPQEIYNAKNRVVERLREIVRRYEDEKIGGVMP